MSSPKVLIIGCGIAGPVVALFLKQKGYSPIVLERSSSLGYEGSAISLAPNGLKVLTTLGLTASWTDAVQVYETSSELTCDGTLLAESAFASRMIERYGHPIIGMLRSLLNRTLKNALSSAGIPLISGFKVSKIIEEENRVTVVAEDERKEDGSFVIGCDGLNSVVRASVLKSHGLPFEPVDFTEIVQHRGISPIPRSMLDHPKGIIFVYGPSSYFTYYTVTSDSCLWALYQRPKVGVTEWSDSRHLTSAEEEARKNELSEDLNDWPEFVKDAVSNTGELIFLKICDRKVLPPEKWYSAKGRVCVLGDAAHPITPHNGQGANQALEDAWHLGQLFPTFTSTTPPATPPSADPLTSSKLKAIFEAFAQKRQPRTASVMNISRGIGELKCPTTPEGEKKRNEYFKAIGANAGATPKLQDDWFSQPF